VVEHLSAPIGSLWDNESGGVGLWGEIGILGDECGGAAHHCDYQRVDWLHAGISLGRVETLQAWVRTRIADMAREAELKLSDL
jgi:hypothetical protein